MSAVQPREADPNDERLLSLLVKRTGTTAAIIGRSWAAEPGAFVVSVTPTGTDSAPIRAWVRSGNLYLTVAQSSAEVRGTSETSWDFLDGVAEAVVAGRVSEAGRGEQRRLRAETRTGTRTFGRAGLPLPWRWRRARRFSPYPA